MVNEEITTIYVAADHAGYSQKTDLIRFIAKLGYQVIDYGTNSWEPVDYPDFAKKIAQAVQKDSHSYGILICGSGVGVCIAANKFKGIRAALVDKVEAASYAVAHDKSNVLCLSGRFVSLNDNCEIVKKFLTAKFEAGRHQIRVEKINQFEK